MTPEIFRQRMLADFERNEMRSGLKVCERPEFDTLLAFDKQRVYDYFYPFGISDTDNMIQFAKLFGDLEYAIEDDTGATAVLVECNVVYAKKTVTMYFFFVMEGWTNDITEARIQNQLDRYGVTPFILSWRLANFNFDTLNILSSFEPALTRLEKQLSETHNLTEIVRLKQNIREVQDQMYTKIFGEEINTK